MPMTRRLYLVARERPLLYGYLIVARARETGGPEGLRIVVDRRRPARREHEGTAGGARPEVERRAAPDIERVLSARGYTILRQASDGTDRWIHEAQDPRSGPRARSAGRRLAMLLGAGLAALIVGATALASPSETERLLDVVAHALSGVRDLAGGARKVPSRALEATGADESPAALAEGFREP